MMVSVLVGPIPSSLAPSFPDQSSLHSPPQSQSVPKSLIPGSKLGWCLSPKLTGSSKLAGWQKRERWCIMRWTFCCTKNPMRVSLIQLCAVEEILFSCCSRIRIFFGYFDINCVLDIWKIFLCRTNFWDDFESLDEVWEWLVDSMRKWPNLERVPLQTNTQQTLITYKSKHKQINKLAENITGMTDSYFVSSQLLRSQPGTHSDPSHIRRFLRMILVMIIIMTKMTKVLILSASFASIYRRTLHRQ